MLPIFFGSSKSLRGGGNTGARGGGDGFWAGGGGILIPIQLEAHMYVSNLSLMLDCIFFLQTGGQKL